MRILVVLLLLLAWYFFSWAYMDVKKNQCCTGDTQVRTIVAPATGPPATISDADPTEPTEPIDDTATPAFRGEETAGQPDTPEPSSVAEVDGKGYIYFQWGSVRGNLGAEVADYLDEIVARVQDTNDQIILTGHTDDSSSSDFNMRLGKRRANAVRAVLVKKGIQPSRIRVRSMGETKPIASNDTEEGREMNRRVELEIIPR